MYVYSTSTVSHARAATSKRALYVLAVIAALVVLPAAAFAGLAGSARTAGAQPDQSSGSYQEKEWQPLASASTTSTPIANVGYQDANFGSTVTEPTARDAQHKLWFNDGIWWASMYNASPDRLRYEIYRLDNATQAWSTTDTVIDTRAGSYADTLWDGTHLYIGSGAYPGRGTNRAVLLTRYSYNSTARVYIPDSGFPITLDTAAVIAVVLGKDSLGRVWATYTKPQDPTCIEQGPPSCVRAVFVTHGTTPDNTAWVAPYRPPVNNTTGLGADNLSALVRFGGDKIGLVWDHGPNSALYFTYHVDSAPDNQWSPTITVARKADNHINLKMIESDPDGALYALVKNDCNEQPLGCSVNAQGTPTVNPNDALIWLFAINATSVSSHTVSRVQDEQTRAILAVDGQNRQLYVFATTYYNTGTPGGLRNITYKQSGLDNLSFPVGRGTTFIQSSSSTNINDPTTTRQSTTAASGIVVLASDSTTRNYFHNIIGSGAPPTWTPTNTPVTGATPTATSTACSIIFQDVPPGSTFYPFVTCLACLGIVNGYPCGGPSEPCNGTDNPYFRPGNPVTRGQLSKIVSEAAGFEEQVDGQTFEDIAPGSTFYIFVERLADRGVIGGYACGGTGEPCGPGSRPYFRPGAQATRGQLSKIVGNAAGFQDPISPDDYTFADVQPESTFFLFIERLLLNRPGVISGYPCGGAGEPCDEQQRPYFRPGGTLSRGQISKIVSGTFFPGCAP